MININSIKPNWHTALLILMTAGMILDFAFWSLVFASLILIFSDY